jgi:hypothetical protein
MMLSRSAHHAWLFPQHRAITQLLSQRTESQAAWRRGAGGDAPSFFQSWSMSWIICRVSVSCRKPSRQQPGVPLAGAQHGAERSGVVGRGHASLLTILDAWHSKLCTDISTLAQGRPHLPQVVAGLDDHPQGRCEGVEVAELQEQRTLRAAHHAAALRDHAARGERGIDGDLVRRCGSEPFEDCPCPGRVSEGP